MKTHALHTLVSGLVRRTWLVALVASIVCAGFAASAVAALVEASYLTPRGHGGVVAPGAVAQVKTPQRTLPDGSGLVVRNMFCSTCTPAIDDELGPTDSFIPSAILIATDLGEDPIATVRVPASEVQGSFGVGDEIPGVGKVARIGWVSVDVLDATGRRGRLKLLDPAAVHGDAGAATPDPAAAAAEPWAGRIKKIDDHTFEVERDLVREMVSGTVKPGGARIVPVTDKGELKGLRMFGVATTSLAGELGLKNGDVLSSINNKQIQSAQTLLDVYGNIDQLSTVELDGTRGGKPLQLTLRLR